MFKELFKQTEGATAIEYALIAGIMATCLIGVMPFITNAITTAFATWGADLLAYH